MDAVQVTAELVIGGGGKVGFAHALLPTDGGIGAAWQNDRGEVTRRFFVDGRGADVGLTGRSNPGSPLGLPVEGSDAFQQLLQIADQTLLVGRRVRAGSLTGPSAIRAGTLVFP